MNSGSPPRPGGSGLTVIGRMSEQLWGFNEIGVKRVAAAEAAVIIVKADKW